MKKIDIILIFTSTALSKIIKIATKVEFAHVSIALDEKLKEIYSFGRLNPHILFIGGFVMHVLKEVTPENLKDLDNVKPFYSGC